MFFSRFQLLVVIERSFVNFGIVEPTLAKYKNLLSSRVMVGEYDSLIEAYDKGKVYDELKKSAPEYAPKYHIVNDYQNFLKAVEIDNESYDAWSYGWFG